MITLPDRTSQQMKRELVVILEMAKLLEKPLDAPRTIEGILRLLAQLYGLNCGRVSLPITATNTLEVIYSYGLAPEDLKAGRFNMNINQGVTGHVMRTGSIGLVPDVSKEPLFIYRVAELSHHTGGRVTFIAVPILESGIPIGVLSAQREGLHERPFNDDISLLRIAASMIGQVLRINQPHTMLELVSDEDSLSGDKIKRSLSSDISTNLPQHIHHEKAASQPRAEVGNQTSSANGSTQRRYGRSYNWVNQDEAEHIRAMLVATKNNQSEAARRMNISLRQLRYRVSKLGIDLH